jgi:hypothetical protein
MITIHTPCYFHHIIETNYVKENEVGVVVPNHILEKAFLLMEVQWQI